MPSAPEMRYDAAMKSRWNDSEAAALGGSPLALRVYTSRLLGAEPSLVLHGGGNTSVKIRETNLFGREEHLLYVKGSGWDLKTIEAKGFAPVRMETLLDLAGLERLSDSDMVRVQRSAMTDPSAPTPSVEAILHALLPHRFVDHTHADAIVALTNTPRGPELIREVLGERILYIPYVMPGFVLARHVFEATRGLDWARYDGMVLLHHGLFTFSDDAKESYEKTIRIVTLAEERVPTRAAISLPSGSAPLDRDELVGIATLRRAVSAKLGAPAIVRHVASSEARAFADRADVESVATRGPLTPDHILHTKRVPLILPRVLEEASVRASLEAFERDYRAYFERHAAGRGLTMLDPAPRWAIWPGHGTFAIGPTAARAAVVDDITRHTRAAVDLAERMGGWVALPERDLFDMEYWELEQAKLGKASSVPALTGKVALVTGAAGGIGKASVEALRAAGAAVVALDVSPSITSAFQGEGVLGLVCDVTDRVALEGAVARTVEAFGGLDIVVPNAGIFPASQPIGALEDELWERTIAVNLTSQMALLRACAPFLVLGHEPAIVVVASKNVPAPGPGAAAYSASKAGLTQLARVAALELGPKGVRVNVLHPHAVMDTALWTPELLESRAKHYGMTTDEYKRNNLLKVEVRSKDVAALVVAMAGPLFGKTTGAQVPVDGGSDRII
jgi:rhamnose utilization protein RhaD (predicted bifunctional aldolase and dehydrogenase)/NAD(P)-dependent dehydrogenase (short-subunit alcohol dehydrogenase family)